MVSAEAEVPNRHEVDSKEGVGEEGRKGKDYVEHLCESLVLASGFEVTAGSKKEGSTHHEESKE